jgi:hypothetical protein
MQQSGELPPAGVREEQAETRVGEDRGVQDGRRMSVLGHGDCFISHCLHIPHPLPLIPHLLHAYTPLIHAQ